MTVATVCPNCSAPLRVAGDTPSARCPHCRTAFRTSSSCALLAGRFELLHELGRGACGVVHEARDHAQNGRIVAVKRLLNAGAGDAEASHRLQREASIMAGVVHPNILPILAHGWAEEGGWVAMPRVPGITLKDAIPPGGIADPRQAVRLAVQVLRALHHVYSAHGVLHRDVKPGNVLLHEDGQSVYLIDFGLAVPPDPDKAMRTSDGILLGTPAYMPPEQARGQLGKLSHAVDVYAAAALLFHLLTGRVPFPAPYPAVLFDISQKKPPVPSSLRAGLDEKLDELVLRGLAKRPEQRPANAGVFADTLEAWLAGPGRPVKQQRRPSLPPPPVPSGSTVRRAQATEADSKRPPEAPPGHRAGRLWLWWLAAAILMAVAGGIYLTRGSPDGEKKRLVWEIAKNREAKPSY